MKKYIIPLLLSVIILSCQQYVKENINPLEIDERIAIFDSLFSKVYKEEAFSGNILIAEKGEVVFKKSYGIKNRETGEKLNENTVFELASVSKQFTAMGIVQLEKAGKLSYDDNILQYIPELSDYPDVTILNLLIHTSGLPDYMELAEDNWDKSKIMTNNDVIQLFQKLKPRRLFESNEHYEYSNTGYLLLATIIERVTGQSLDAYLKSSIFDPLTMTNTSIYQRHYKPRTIKNYAWGYMYSDSLETYMRPKDMGSDFYTVYLDGIVGDGMVNSNAGDLLKWDRALYGNKLVDDSDKEIIFSSYRTNDSYETDYGFGWEIDSTKAYGKIVSHSGGWSGYSTYIERHIDNDKTIIILQNINGENSKIPFVNTLKALYNIPIEVPIKLNDEVLNKYTGTYLTKKGTEKKISIENGKLQYPITNKVNLELTPVSQIKFILDNLSPEATLTFITNDSDEVVKCRLQQSEEDIDIFLERK